MKLVTKSILLLLALGLIFPFVAFSQTATNDKYVVMLSLDAFRWDYSTLTNTPNLDKIAKEGVKAKALIPCYPSKTFPNHYSMATGLHPDHHGIVMNSFYDSTLGYYSMKDRAAVGNGAFYGGEPIWVTAEKQGIISASYFWVGSEAPVKGIHPTYWKPYEQRSSLLSRLDTVIHWLSLPLEQRPRLITWYFHEPDAIAHKLGPTHPKTLAYVQQLDSIIGVFISEIESLPIADKVNILIVSDHGMADISPSQYINLSQYISKDDFEFVTGGNPVYTLQPKKGEEKKVLKRLKSIPNLKVYTRNDIPQRLVYGGNHRVHDIIIEAELGYSIGFSSKTKGYSGGAHGYDNAYPDMHGIFYAKGEAFKKGYEHNAFQNIELYGIICKILGLTPQPTDGDISKVNTLFNNQ